jgi:two-component system response regulator MprA
VSLQPSIAANGRVPVPGAVLVVDDEAQIRDIVAVSLRGAGYSAHCAEDGEAGWAAFCANHFDALITDHEMPRLTGLDLIRRLRAVPIKVPVILISGRMPCDEENLSRVLPPGIALKKPFSIAELLTHLRAMLIPPASATQGFFNSTDSDRRNLLRG